MDVLNCDAGIHRAPLEVLITRQIDRHGSIIEERILRVGIQIVLDLSLHRIVLPDHRKMDLLPVRCSRRLESGFHQRSAHVFRQRSVAVAADGISVVDYLP